MVAVSVDNLPGDLAERLGISKRFFQQEFCKPFSFVLVCFDPIQSFVERLLLGCHEGKSVDGLEEQAEEDAVALGHSFLAGKAGDFGLMAVDEQLELRLPQDVLAGMVVRDMPFEKVP